MQKYLVTGATGFLGKAYVDKLLSEKEHVIVLVRNRNKAYEFWGNKVHIVEREANSIGNICAEDLQITDGDKLTVIHFLWDGTAGIKRTQEEIQLNNILCSCSFLRKVKELGCTRFINAGSIMEYEAMKMILADGMLPSPNVIYSTAKLAADFMLKTISAELKVEYINVIISNIYGPGEFSERFLNTIVRKMMRGDSLQLTEGKQLYDFIYVDDAMNMLHEIAKRGNAFESYYIGNEKQAPLRQYVEKAHEIIESTSELDFGAIPFAGKPLDYTEFTCDKVMKELGIYPQIKFEEGIKILMEKVKESE